MMNSFVIKALICCLLGTCIAKAAFAQEFPCDGAFYFVSTNSVIGSEFYKLVFDEITQDFNYIKLPLDNPEGRHITCLSYNVNDKMIYGLDFNSYELMRIGSDGSLVSLGVPDNLDMSFEYYAGTMTPDGKSMVLVARNPETGIDERVYLITMNRNPPNYYAGYFSVVSDLPVAMTDIIVDPWVGGMYGFDEHNGQLIVTDITGQTSTSHRSFENVRQVFGSLFFDRQGQLYGLGNSAGGGAEQAILYEIDKGNGKTTRLQGATGGRDTDGCGCPYTLEFYKSITPTKTAGCNEVMIDYQVINRAGIAQVGARLFDELPLEFDIVDVDMENMNIVDVNSGIGTNVLDISRWNVLLGENIVRVMAKIKSATPGVLKSQATLGEFPLALGTTLVSDDPLTVELDDSTSLEIINTADYRLQDYAVPSCDLDTFFLTMPLEGDYLWSTGSIEPVLPVVEEGNYSVTITTECFVISDSVFVEMEAEPLFVDLGEDRQADLGDIVRLNFVTNAVNVSGIQWSASNNTALSCDNCPNPELTAGKEIKISVRIIDQRGCSATDELTVTVDETKKIFAPNVFSPNSDGVNDVFFIQGRSAQITTLYIFDRWGNLVFEQKELGINDWENGWNGTYNGQKVPAGQYVWTASVLFPDGQTKRYSGNVMVMY